MTFDIRKRISEILFLKSTGQNVPEELAELLEVCKRCLKAESERDRLREAIWPGLPAFVPTPENPQEDFYILMVEGLHKNLKQDD